MRIFRILYWVYAIAAFIPIYSLVSNTIKIPIINIIISLFITGIPIINLIVGIIGAISVMQLPVIGVLLFYLAPPIILPLFVLSRDK